MVECNGDLEATSRAIAEQWVDAGSSDGSSSSTMMVGGGYSGAEEGCTGICYYLGLAVLDSACPPQPAGPALTNCAPGAREELEYTCTLAILQDARASLRIATLLLCPRRAWGAAAGR